MNSHKALCNAAPPWLRAAQVSFGSIGSILTCPRYVRLAGNSGNVDWLLNGSTLGVIHLVYAPTSIRIRHPSCSPTVARRPADRERSPTIRLGDVATAVAVPGVAFRAARITRGWATSPREAHWLDFLTRRSCNRRQRSS